MSLKNLLDCAVDDGFQKLDKMEVGSDSYVATAKVLNEMSDRINNADRIILDSIKHEEEMALKEKEVALREKEIKHEQVDRYIKHGLTAISVIGGIALTVWGAKASWRFEETGTITSTPGRKFINNLFFKK